MGIRKAAGILVLSVQPVVSADFYFQTRDAGLGPGELSVREYAAIVHERFARVRAERAAAAQPADTMGTIRKLGKRIGTAFTGAEEVAGTEEAPARVCVRRGTTLDCG
ncbi:hypothetical protein ACUXV3_08325 [Roseobacteraceae bacterium NS-SX3]